MKYTALALLLLLALTLPVFAQQNPASTEEPTTQPAAPTAAPAQPTAETEDAMMNPYVIEGTVAYWSFDGEETPDGEPLAAEDIVVVDLSGSGNDLYRMDMENGEPEHLIWSDEHAEDMPSMGSIRILGNNDTQIGAYLITAEDAPLNLLTFEDGYTVEAFVKMPEDWSPETNRWTGILGRRGTGGDAGKTETDLAEPVGHLAVSNFPEFQWAVWPTNLEGIQTNWSDQLVLGEWYHVAIVNDGDVTLMYVNGEEVLRNPDPGQIGITTVELPWTIGSTHYDNVPNTFNGWIGDIRIVARALSVDEFLTAEPAQ